MLLFIDPISVNIELFVIENGEVRHTSTIPKWKDADEFPQVLNDIIYRHEIDTIATIIWPGAFTRMRIITLALNTINLVKNIPLKGCHFFDLIEWGSPILIANNHEYIVLGENGPKLVEKSELKSSEIYIGYADKNDFTDEKNFIEYTRDFRSIEKIFASIPAGSRLSPIYLKEPHITWSKKNIFPSSKTANKS